MSWPATSRVIPSDMGMFVVAPAPGRGGGIIPQYYDSTYATSDKNNAAATALGVGVIHNPHPWQQQQMSVGGGVTATCQDCGNQSKKDCSHSRCRTCCKSRGFDCSTHVRSTWVPAARRRERHSIIASSNNGGEGGGGGGSSGSSSGAKKPKILSPQTTSNNSISNTPPPNFDTSSSHHQDAGFKEMLPGQVRAPAMFKCVKVTAMEDGNDELAYQAVVKIGGHIFKGFLYDQGAQPNDGIRAFSELHLGGGSGRRDGGFVSLQTPPFLDRNEVYGGGSGGGSGGLIGVSGYGNTIN